MGLDHGMAWEELSSGDGKNSIFSLTKTHVIRPARPYFQAECCFTG